MIKPSCAKCRFWVSVPEKIYGACRRNAPLADGALHTEWPLTDEDEWCGEFKLPIEYSANTDEEED